MRPPLSIRQNQPGLDVPLVEGIPQHMFQGVLEWVSDIFGSAFLDPEFGSSEMVKQGYVTEKVWSKWEADLRRRLQRAEQHLRRPLDWDQDLRSVKYQLLGWLDDNEAGLDLVDYCLSQLADADAIELDDMLEGSGSVWTVAMDGEMGFCLERRMDRTVRKGAQRELEQAGNPAAYLREAWSAIYRRNPNPSSGYRDAVRAIEAACHPTVIPDDPKATLGKAIAAMKVKPEKWVTEIGDVDTVLRMLESVWQSQSDRHGTDEVTRPLNVTQQEAEAALHLALALVHLFRTKAIRRASQHKGTARHREQMCDDLSEELMLLEHELGVVQDRTPEKATMD